MLLENYLQEDASPEEVERQLRALFPDANIKTARDSVSLEVFASEAPARIKGRVLEVDGIFRSDWMR